MGTLGGLNRKRTSIVKKRNKILKQNKKNKLEKQAKAPKFTTKPLSKKKARLLLKHTEMHRFHGSHARQLQRANKANAMQTEAQVEEEPEQRPEKMKM